jgi:hypothetical protein
MDYQLIIKIPFEAMDDLAARQTAKCIERELIESNEDFSDLTKEYKLQNVFPDKPPRGIKI